MPTTNMSEAPIQMGHTSRTGITSKSPMVAAT
jgi:hypothetical protein